MDEYSPLHYIHVNDYVCMYMDNNHWTLIVHNNFCKSPYL